MREEESKGGEEVEGEREGGMKRRKIISLHFSKSGSGTIMLTGHIASFPSYSILAFSFLNSKSGVVCEQGMEWNEASQVTIKGNVILLTPHTSRIRSTISNLWSHFSHMHY